jgi:hypothetical protein
MNKAFIHMEKIWKRYEKDYDNMYGEFAFADKFRLSPIYVSEHETDSENEDLNEELNEELLFET